MSNDPNYPFLSSRQVHHCAAQQPYKSRRGKVPRARSGSISISSLSALPASPVNRFAQSMGPERPKPTNESVWTRHTTPAMSTRRGDFVFDDSWDFSYAAKSNRRSVWQRIAENVDKCVFRVMSKFYK
ncbi:hypothetical protein L917_14364 [Phytophthora nicotianae]|uniref:Uncharacterized protein n=2 Tax=Phytophthora nicotianae TaxID=4792 RepID=W2KPC5_PHYNI|nr:hypothetical protein L917_14364 [Phytophthora nicotianae]ETO68079.1 hypothetical protein F444_15073 [Phytophthora nicotianae P1976]